MTKVTLTDVVSGYQSANAINANNQTIEDAFDNTLSRDGTSPNTMGADLDMNSNDILNVGTVNADDIVVDGSSVAASAAASATSAAAAAVSEANAATSEANASSSASSAATSAANIADWEYTGTWTTATAYQTNNIVYVNAGTYDGYSMIALSDHTSDATSFDNDYPAKWGILVKKGGSGAGSGDLIAANNLSDVADAATSRINLGLQIGVNVQAYDAELAAFAGLTSAADKVPYFTGSGTAAVADFSSYGRTIVNFASKTAAFDGLSPLTTQADLIYHDGTNNTRLAKGTANQILQMNSGATAPEWTTLVTSGGLTFISSADASNDATIEFTGFDAGTYDAYLFVFNNVIPAIDDRELYIRFSNDGGSTYEGGTGYYAWGMVGNLFGNSGVGAKGSASATYIGVTDTYIGDSIGSATGEDGWSGTIWVLGPGLTKKTQVIFHGTYPDASGVNRVWSGGGIVKTAEANDAIQFLMQSGDIESGTITMYGLRNSS